MTSTVSSAEPLVQGAFFKPCELSAPFNWQPGLLRKLDELRCMGQFCDVTIQVDDTIGDASFLPYMRVHSVIVAAGSPMLHEKLQDPSFAGSVLVAGVGVWQWEQVINFLYTGKVCLTASGQAEALVQAAIELKMEVLVNMLQDHLGPSDAAAVEDVKPLKSRQAADTSEPMDDDDEDNDAVSACVGFGDVRVDHVRDQLQIDQSSTRTSKRTFTRPKRFDEVTETPYQSRCQGEKPSQRIETIGGEQDAPMKNDDFKQNIDHAENNSTDVENKSGESATEIDSEDENSELENEEDDEEYYPKKRYIHKSKKLGPTEAEDIDKEKELREYFKSSDGGFIELPLLSMFCLLCNETYPKRSFLREHIIKTHGEDKVIEAMSPAPSLIPVKCPRCPVVLSRRETMHHLWRIHELRVKTLNPYYGERIYYKCRLCGFRNTCPSSLKLHTDSVHKGVKAFMCEVCGQCHAKQLDLDRHMRTHTDERPYKCPHCPKSFRRHHALSNHEPLHTGYKPHTCNLCGKQFVQVTSINLHFRNHHKTLAKEEWRNSRTYTPLRDVPAKSLEVKDLPECKSKKKKTKSSLSLDTTTQETETVTESAAHTAVNNASSFQTTFQTYTKLKNY